MLPNTGGMSLTDFRKTYTRLQSVATATTLAGCREFLAASLGDSHAAALHAACRSGLGCLTCLTFH